MKYINYINIEITYKLTTNSYVKIENRPLNCGADESQCLSLDLDIRVVQRSHGDLEAPKCSKEHRIVNLMINGAKVVR